MGTAPERAIGESRRITRPSWKDPRLLLGILIVLASTVGIIALTSALDKTVPMYVAKTDISLGEQLGPEKLDVANIKLDALSQRYVAANPELLVGRRANSLIRAGELIPVGSIGLEDGTNRRPVSVNLPDELPAAITAGAHVDVWVAAKDRAANVYSAPTLLLPGAEVTYRVARATGFGGTSGTTVELLVHDQKLADLLEAMANEARITLVFNPTASSS
ncbi:hypothetical protein CQ018_00915 [Arthrobacter sp. MYb227]|uniref:SAF domain-containing protein n=1 Tax=Arthrobacter sp. MYb227 TaxID=1848601 RepID=UPI000CFADD2B|nr:SAF domain-containing protein [Arthrobacter sp. MYb227]PQZ95891.1 hypothetical protein CQ018_00915 [Arthrobacter sp. MYb227]